MMTQIEEIRNSGIKLTPMMEQYFDIKSNYSEHLLMFRMGDFYEVFFEDAKMASKILNIALTHRGKIGDQPIPMAGIPHHAAAAYVDRFASHGIKVAICEQIEDPKEAKGIVKRAVTQVVSPAMPYDLEKTISHENHFIVSTILIDDKYFLVAIDFTTGVFKGHELKTKEDLIEKIRSLAPKEFITYLGQWDCAPEIKVLLEHQGTLVTNLSSEYFGDQFTQIYIEKLIPTYKRDQVINENKDVLAPIGALSYYICSTQSTGDFVHIQPFALISETGFMKVTIPTLTGLEILPKSKESYNESLLGFMDKTQTALGARTLRDVFSSPLTDTKKITDRQSVITYFLENDSTLKDTRNLLSEVRDLERILAKVSTAKANAGDLLNIASAVNVFEELSKILQKLPINNLKELSKSQVKELVSLKDIINSTINDEVGASLEKGNLVKDGADKERDRLCKLSRNASEELLRLEANYRETTGISKLRIKSNNVNGYFIEISKSQTDKVPESFTRRQTLVNSERYTTSELSEFEKEVILASERLLKLEREIFKSIIENVITVRSHIQLLASILSKIDVLQSLSWIARSEDFVCPKLSKKKKQLSLQGAWHPLIKSAIKDQFISHNLELDSKKYFGLITGPNMAGKTTVMREVAIIQLLTQIGSFVPCTSATVSVCDYLFSRLGASDDILKGQSTFMVEMAETAEILRHASEESLIILDEVGRGTSTYDGLSIAWALVEHFINKTKSICLFATHYHELIDLANSFEQAKNLTVETANNNGDVKFLYRLIEKSASQSFGIYVAKLAGLPSGVLIRSQQILKTLEKNHNHAQGLITLEGNGHEQLSFFESSKEQEAEIITVKEESEVENEIKLIDLNNMTPMQALQKIQELKNRLMAN